MPTVPSSRSVQRPGCHARRACRGPIHTRTTHPKLCVASAAVGDHTRGGTAKVSDDVVQPALVAPKHLLSQRLRHGRRRSRHFALQLCYVRCGCVQRRGGGRAWRGSSVDTLQRRVQQWRACGARIAATSVSDASAINRIPRAVDTHQRHCATQTLPRAAQPRSPCEQRALDKPQPPLG